MRIDAHQHVWTIARGDYTWLTPALGPIYRDFSPDDLAPHLTAAGIDATVLVQAAGTTAETQHMLDVADVTPFIAGVVGWIDFEDPAQIDLLRVFTRHPKFRGVRPLIQDIADVDWMLRADLGWAFEAIQDLDLTFDALGHPRHLANFLTLFQRYPRMRVVIDHAMKPAIADGAFDDWADGIERLATETEAFCKLSGLVTEAGAKWGPEQLKPYITHIIKVFGARRVMWGSDWPVVNLASEYGAWLHVAEALVAEICGDDPSRSAIFGGTAKRFYRLGIDAT